MCVRLLPNGCYGFVVVEVVGVEGVVVVWGIEDFDGVASVVEVGDVVGLKAVVAVGLEQLWRAFMLAVEIGVGMEHALRQRGEDPCMGMFP